MTLTSINFQHFTVSESAWTRFQRSRSLQQGQRSNQGHTMTLHIYNHQPMPLPNISFLRLMVSEILSGQDFQTHGHYIKVKSQIKITP